MILDNLLLTIIYSWHGTEQSGSHHSTQKIWPARNQVKTHKKLQNDLKSKKSQEQDKHPLPCVPPDYRGYSCVFCHNAARSCLEIHTAGKKR